MAGSIGRWRLVKHISLLDEKFPARLNVVENICRPVKERTPEFPRAEVTGMAAEIPSSPYPRAHRRRPSSLTLLSFPPPHIYHLSTTFLALNFFEFSSSFWNLLLFRVVAAAAAAARGSPLLKAHVTTSFRSRKMRLRKNGNQRAMGIGGKGRARVYRQGVAVKFNSTCTVVRQNSWEFDCRICIEWGENRGGECCSVFRATLVRHAETDTENVFGATTSMPVDRREYFKPVFFAAILPWSMERSFSSIRSRPVSGKPFCTLRYHCIIIFRWFCTMLYTLFYFEKSVICVLSTISLRERIFYTWYVYVSIVHTNLNQTFSVTYYYS